eukprot:TRINITY_DN1153_c0_g1_i4.p2 TRINITY_DN1153_c0_g1~~TRINITY_DN1153_c0_g1_i4.p2  ORF type:complete len:160 (+),score=33.79 TRINITY_DN1153_c0_g1_i4:69-548(+)
MCIRDSYKAFEEENQKLKSDVETLKNNQQPEVKESGDVNNVSASNNSNNAAIAELQEKYEQLQTDYKKLKDTYDRIEKGYVQYKIDVANSEYKNEALAEQVKKLEKTVKVREKALKKLEEELATTKNDQNEIIKAVQEGGNKDLISQISKVVNKSLTTS